MANLLVGKWNTQMEAILKDRWKTWKNMERSVFIDLMMEINFKDNLEMILFITGSMFPKKRTCCMKDILTESLKRTGRVN